jgi:hypothetical protein
MTILSYKNLDFFFFLGEGDLNLKCLSWKHQKMSIELQGTCH